MDLIKSCRKYHYFGATTMKRHLPTLFFSLLILATSTVIDANAQAKAGSAEAHVAAAGRCV
jgi:hypothetical protein